LPLTKLTTTSPKENINNINQKDGS